MAHPASRRWLAGPVLGSLLAGAAANAAAPTGKPVWRQDVGADFGRAVCSGALDHGPQAAWAAGVYDARGDGQFLQRPGGLAVDAAELALRARSLAAVRRSGGYAYGSCPDASRGWIMTTAAPDPLSVAKNAVLSLPLAPARARCLTLRADFAPRAVAASQPVALHEGHGRLMIRTAGLGDGALSLTCQPKAPRWRGPTLWYLVPIGQGPAATLPAAMALGSEAEATIVAPAGGTLLTAKLARWINGVRAAAQLQPLTLGGPGGALDHQAEILAADASLNHDRELLRHVAGQLRGGQVQLLGEDRVKGRSAGDMAWLLWNSPRHRDLLLSPKAGLLGMASRPDGEGEQLVVLITAEGSAAAVSRRDQGKKPAAKRAL